MMYYHGYGVSTDLATARAWLQKAAARGYAPAKEMLAKLDAAGDSVTANAAADADVSSRDDFRVLSRRPTGKNSNYCGRLSFSA